MVSQSQWRITVSEAVKTTCAEEFPKMAIARPKNAISELCVPAVGRALATTMTAWQCCGGMQRSAKLLLLYMLSIFQLWLLKDLPTTPVQIPSTYQGMHGSKLGELVMRRAVHSLSQSFHCDKSKGTTHDHRGMQEYNLEKLIADPGACLLQCS